MSNVPTTVSGQLAASTTTTSTTLTTIPVTCTSQTHDDLTDATSSTDRNVNSPPSTQPQPQPHSYGPYYGAGTALPSRGSRYSGPYGGGPPAPNAAAVRPHASEEKEETEEYNEEEAVKSYYLINYGGQCCVVCEREERTKEGNDNYPRLHGPLCYINAVLIRHLRDGHIFERDGLKTFLERALRMINGIENKKIELKDEEWKKEFNPRFGLWMAWRKMQQNPINDQVQKMISDGVKENVASVLFEFHDSQGGKIDEEYSTDDKESFSEELEKAQRKEGENAVSDTEWEVASILKKELDELVRTQGKL